jgi:peptide deformylase
VDLLQTKDLSEIHRVLPCTVKSPCFCGEIAVLSPCRALGLARLARCCYHVAMAMRHILQLGDPLLRAVSQPTPPEDATGTIQDLEETLAEFRRAHGFGRAISAIQIGRAVRVIFLQMGGLRYELINPEITWFGPDTFTLWDDCFSFPNLLVRLERRRAVRLSYQTPAGVVRELEAFGALSELIQHEVDHLDGVLAVDRALDRDSLCTREEWLRRHSSE